MWTSTPDFERLVQLQSAGRLEELSKTRTRRTKELENQFAARGTLRGGGFQIAALEMTTEAFVTAGTGLIADFLGIASDVGNESAALDWLENRFGQLVEQLANGLQRSMTEGPRAMPQAAGRITREISQAATRLKRDGAIAFGRVRLRRPQPGSAELPQTVEQTRDFFISHAGEDRTEFVAPLVEELSVRRGKSVWYSEFELTLGDSLLRKIDEGLRMSRHGVVVLSPNFFRKPWPRAELDGLAARAAVEGRKVILPVWHGLGHAELAQYSPSLAGLVGIETSHGVSVVADAIIAASEKDS